jgi:sulfur-oxidizing protein SoxX
VWASTGPWAFVPAHEAWAQGATAVVQTHGYSAASEAEGAGSTLDGAKAAADAMPVPLTAVPGDAARGRAIVADRRVGLCLLCHSGPFPEVRFQGDLAPDLRGAGSRWSEAQLRQRIVDSRRVNPDSLMPAYHRTDGLVRVAAPFAGKPVLSAQQVEDVVAFLLGLRD